MFMRPSPPRFALPHGGCDSHVHLFGPYDRYPLAPVRSFTPDPAPVSELFAMLDGSGIERAVIVQASAQGTDNRLLIDSLKAHPARLRGVVVIDTATISEKELEAMHAAGVRGVRLNLVSTAGGSPAEVARRAEAAAAKIAPFGWHLQFFINSKIIDDVAPMVARLPVEVVFDHMGFLNAAAGSAQPGYASLLKLLAAGRTWVKLSGTYRISSETYGDADVTKLARTLFAANKERALWASDWPHIAPHGNDLKAGAPHVDFIKIDYGRLLSALADWADGDDLMRILVRNPAKLYGFT
jgi:predicted TIM-barrel fold metal-dependent hydrolase